MVVIKKKHKESAEEKQERLEKEQQAKAGIQDEFQAQGFELVQWVQDHKGKVSAIIVTLLVCLGMFAGYTYYQDQAARIASEAYFKALSSLEGRPSDSGESGKLWAKAQQDLASLADAKKSSGVTSLANLFAGHIALELANHDEAIQRYTNVVNSLNAQDNLFSLGLIGLGFALEKSGQLEKSLEKFEELIKNQDRSYGDLALWEAARLASKTNNSQKAQGYLTRLFEEFPSSVYEKSAKKLHNSLAVKPGLGS